MKQDYKKTVETVNLSSAFKKRVIKSVTIAFVSAFILMFVFAFVINFTDASDSIINTSSIIILFASSLVCGIVSAKPYKSKGFLDCLFLFL